MRQDLHSPHASIAPARYFEPLGTQDSGILSRDLLGRTSHSIPLFVCRTVTCFRATRQSQQGCSRMHTTRYCSSGHGIRVFDLKLLASPSPKTLPTVLLRLVDVTLRFLNKHLVSAQIGSPTKQSSSPIARRDRPSYPALLPQSTSD